MSLKAELETWAAALKAYDEEDFDRSLDLFSRISESSKILTNMGLIFATLGEHEAAVEKFIEATGLDQYLAVAYFQCGVSNFLLARYELAHKDFEEALLYLRGNQDINYEQLGLKFRLYCAEVLFNKGLALLYLGRMQEGMADMEEAKRNKATDEHNVIDDAIQDRGEGYTVFSIPVGVLYRPSERKLKNAVAKDYMGKAKLVAASDPGDAFTEFTGVARLKQGISPSGVYIDQADGVPLGRSMTVSGASQPRAEPKPEILNRSKTTITPMTRSDSGGSTPSAGMGGGLSRSNTSITPARPSANATLGRGLSIRRPDASPSAALASQPLVDRAPPPPLKDQDGPPGPGAARLTEFYDDYIDSYGDSAPPPLPPNSATSPDRIANWARSNANPAGGAPPPGPGLGRMGSRSAPSSSYAPSSVGGSMRRRVTRRGTRSGPRRSAYDPPEEEEGYASGEYDDGPFELIKIRVKLHYEDDVRGMAITPEMPFDEFVDKVTSKFGRPMNGLALKFLDEDGIRVTLRDDSDFDLAIETARENAKGKPEGKLELWCIDA